MKARMNVYFAPEILRRVDELAARRNLSKSLIIEAAVSSFLSPDAEDRREAAFSRRLDRLIRQNEQLERHLAIYSEAVALYVRFWLTVTPPMPESAQEATRAIGAERYKAFVEALMGALAGAARGAASTGSGAVSAYRTAAAASGASGARAAAAGASSVIRTGASAIAERFGGMVRAAATGASPAATSSAPSAPPEWAQRLRRHQTIAHGASAAAHSVRSGDRGGGGTSISLTEDRR